MERWAVDGVVTLIIDEMVRIIGQAQDEYDEYLETGKPSRRINALGLAQQVTALCDVANRLYEDYADDFKEGK